MLAKSTRCGKITLFYPGCINSMNNSDILQRFMFESASVRGEIVRLEESFRTIMQQHQYPPVIQRILGEMLVAASLLSASIKFKGRMTVQFQGKKQVRLLLAQSNDSLELRGLAQWQGELTQDELMADLKQGTLAIMMDPDVEGGQRYQGIVEWHGDSLAHSLENYFNRSEQVPTRLWFAINEERAAGLLIQVMPHESSQLGKGIDGQHDWEHIEHLTATVTPKELLYLDNATLLQRLYQQESIRLFPERPVIFHCQCSIARSENALRLLSEEEVEQELKEKQMIVVTCEFCNSEFQFDRVDVERIFKQGKHDSIH